MQQQRIGKWRWGKKRWLLLKEEALLTDNAEEVHVDCVRILLLAKVNAEQIPWQLKDACSMGEQPREPCSVDKYNQ